MKETTIMPAEYALHEKTLMAWPVQKSMCYPENYQEFTEGLANAAREISRFEPVMMLVNGDTKDEAREMLGDRAEIVVIEHNDCWIRDNGPTLVFDQSGESKGVDWRFNAWGEKYPDYSLDDKVASSVLQHMGIEGVFVPIVMEGGSFHTDGEGTLITTEECLLNQNRNPEINRDEIEKVLRQTLGIEKIIWLPTGLVGDETDGHIDNLACFASPGVVLLQICDMPTDPNYERSLEHRRILENETDAMGRKIEIICIPQPPAAMYRNKPLVLSYLNFYFVNNGIILPVFHAETDKRAIEIIKSVFPDREIIPIDGMKLAKEGGNIHCLTQQIPRAQIP